MDAPKQATEPEDVEQQQEVYVKQGRSCFGCLCDMRRAIVILSALGMIFSIAGVLTNRFLVFDPAQDDADDPEDVNRLEDLFRLHIGMTILAIFGYMFAIRGGLKFNKRLVIANIVIMPAVFVTNTTTFLVAAGEIDEFNFGFPNVIGQAIGFVMSLFVNISFLREMRAGIMTEKNYANEEQSCCCV